MCNVCMISHDYFVFCFDSWLSCTAEYTHRILSLTFDVDVRDLRDSFALPLYSNILIERYSSIFQEDDSYLCSLLRLVRNALGAGT